MYRVSQQVLVKNLPICYGKQIRIVIFLCQKNRQIEVRTVNKGL